VRPDKITSFKRFILKILLRGRLIKYLRAIIVLRNPRGVWTDFHRFNLPVGGEAGNSTSPPSVHGQR
jgi:hypothetical protein